jgi:hypothetical protein
LHFSYNQSAEQQAAISRRNRPTFLNAAPNIAESAEKVKNKI